MVGATTSIMSLVPIMSTDLEKESPNSPSHYALS